MKPKKDTAADVVRAAIRWHKYYLRPISKWDSATDNLLESQFHRACERHIKESKP